jgi:hypothetical protein
MWLILQHDHVIQSETMVDAAANSYCFFFQPNENWGWSSSYRAAVYD